MKFEQYLKNLIEDKGKDLDSEIKGLSHDVYGQVFGVTWHDLIDFLSQMKEYHHTIKSTLVKIDFSNGDVFHYLKHLANGMVNC